MSRFTAPLRLRTRTSLVAAAALVAGLLAIPALPASAAGPATHFSVSTDPSVAAGDALPFTVTALDASDVTADGYTGTVHVTVNNAQVGETVPQDYEFQAGDAGVANLTGILTLAGARTITVTDASDGDISGNTGVDVTPGDATQLAFSSQPSDTFTQHQLGAVSVKITDAYGNQTADNDSIQLSVNTGSFDAGTNPKNASGGAVTFSDLEIDTPGTYTLDASDTTNETVTGATSDSFDILAHADIALTMSASPDGSVGTPAIAGTNETYTLTVTNNGPDMNTSYSVTASVPSGTQKVSAPGCTGTSTLTCSGGALANGASKDFVITVHIGSDYAGADSVQSLSFSATVALTNPTQEPDNSVENDTATQTFDVIGQADLSNTLTAPAAQQIAGAGAGFDYTLKVKNTTGPSDNFGYQSAFTLPSLVSFDSFSGPGGSTCGAVGSGRHVLELRARAGADRHLHGARHDLAVEAGGEQLDQRNGELDDDPRSERGQQHVGERGAPHDHPRGPLDHEDRGRAARGGPRPRVRQQQRRAEPRDVHGHGLQRRDELHRTLRRTGGQGHRHATDGDVVRGRGSRARSAA